MLTATTRRYVPSCICFPIPFEPVNNIEWRNMLARRLDDVVALKFSILFDDALQVCVRAHTHTHHINDGIIRAKTIRKIDRDGHNADIYIIYVHTNIRITEQ